MERYINPYTDYGFKRLFGTDENKELLISFLNAMIFDEDVCRITGFAEEENRSLKKKNTYLACSCLFCYLCILNI